MNAFSQPNNNFSDKSTLLFNAGLIVFMIALSGTQSLAQRNEKREIDSLLSVADKMWPRNFAASDSLYETVSQQIRRRGIEENLSIWVRVLHQRAIACLFHTKLTRAKRYLALTDSSINHYAHVENFPSDSLRIQTQVIKANYFYIIGNYQSALQNLNDSENFLQKYDETPSRCEILYQILQYQASIYYLQGEFESCIDRYLASIQFYDCYRTKKNYPNYILVNRNIGQAYLKKGDIANARYYLFLGKTNFDSCPAPSRDLTIRHHALVLYHSLAEFYRTQDKPDSARYFFSQAQQLLVNNPTYASRVNDGLAKIALAEKDYNTASNLFMKSLEDVIQARGEKHYLTASSYRSISTLYRDQNNFENALIFIQKALNSFSSSKDIDINDFTKNPALSILYMPKEMVMTLHQKATLLTTFYHHRKNIKLLLAAQNTSALALQLLDSTRNEFSLDKDKVVLGEDAAKVYQTGLNIATLLYRETNDQRYLSECFELIDKSKSAVLMDHIKLVRDFSGIPSELVDRERELKVELSVAEQQLYTAEVRKEETSTHRQQLGEIKKSYVALLNDLKLSAPNYYKLRIENKQLTLTEAQNMLQPQELLVEYFFGDSTLYIMAVSPGNADLYTLPIDSLRSQIQALRDMLAKPGKFPDANYQAGWNSNSQSVFRKVVAPWIKHLKSARRVIIVPHDVVNYLPLEMLSDSQTMLLNSVSISYASSVALLREQNNMKPRGNFFAAFNADYSNQPHLPQLAGAAREVNAIENIFGFRSTRFTAATAEDFRKEAANFKIIHLALHSLINDEKPMFSRLVFTRNGDDVNADITANELYSMQLNAEIAVLSACETGLGKLHRGEGMMSLSRAFMYAGVPSTVISLWKVPDQSASILMTKFYRFLKAGHRKDEALQLAKTELIKEHPEMSHPFFWAGFIVNGKTDPVSFPYFSAPELLGIAILSILLLTIVSLMLMKRRRGLKSIAVTH